MPVTIPDTVDSLDDVAPNLKALYEPTDDGKFRAGDAGKLVEAVRNAKEDKKKANDVATKAMDDLKKFEGFDVELYQRLAPRAKEIEDFDKDKGVEIDKIKRGVEDLMNGKLEAEKAISKGFKTALENNIKAGFLEKALIKAGVNERGARFVLPVVSSQISWQWNSDGKNFEPLILDKDGKARHTADFDPMTIEDLLAIEKKENPDFFKSEYGGGGGSGMSSGGAPDPHKTDPKKWDAKMVLDYNKAMGDDMAYIKLMTKKKTA